MGTIRVNTHKEGCFVYDRAYLSSQEPAPISVSLPLQEQAFSAAQTHCFFDGLAIPMRLHQEDFAQALGIPASDKYELPGAHHLQDMFALLRRVSANPVEDQLRLWDILIFDFLIGNSDNHLKNYSLLYSPDLRSIRLAPAYDIVSTCVYQKSTREMAFRIGDARMLDDITRHSFSLASSEAGLGSALALKRFDRMAQLFPSALEKAASQLVYSGYPEAEDLKKMIQLHGGCSHIL